MCLRGALQEVQRSSMMWTGWEMSATLNIGTLVSGLLGVIVGSVLTYFVSLRVDRAKTSDIALRLNCLLIKEISVHQGELEYGLNRIFPAWLRRGEPEALGPEGPIRMWYIQLPTDHFDKYASQLVHHPKLVLLGSYYRRIDVLNMEASRLYDLRMGESDGVPADKNREYIRDCFTAMGQSLYALEQLLNLKGTQRYFTDEIHEAVDYYRENKDRLWLLVKLHSQNRTDLAKCEHKLEEGVSITELPSPLDKDERMIWLDYLRASHRLYSHKQ
jgi:hypothetical protein